MTLFIVIGRSCPKPARTEMPIQYRPSFFRLQIVNAVQPLALSLHLAILF
jgi:hypothetical protein